MADMKALLSLLRSQHFPVPTTAWLQSALGSLPPTTSAQGTTQQQQQQRQRQLRDIQARILSADLTTPGFLDPTTTASLPSPTASASATTTASALVDTTLTHEVPVQVVDVEDVHQSRWSQVEDMEAAERGELTQGRQVIRLDRTDQDDPSDDMPTPADNMPTPTEGSSNSNGSTRTLSATPASSSNPTHRLVLQDARGHRVYGLELVRVPALSLAHLSIGAKLILLPGTVLVTSPGPGPGSSSPPPPGVVLLEAERCLVLGGRIDAWHESWLATRKARLTQLAHGT